MIILLLFDPFPYLHLNRNP